MAGTLVLDTVKSSTSNPPSFLNTSGTEIGQLCRSWVNFNGNTAVIRASYNVSSITKNGTGDYTVNMTNALADANYCVSFAMGSGSTGSYYCPNAANSAPTSSSYRLNVGGTNGLNYDATYVYSETYR